MRSAARNVLGIALLASLIPNSSGSASAAPAAQPWQTSWTAFAQATKAFLDNELSTHPEEPEFPQAGRLLLSVGEVTNPDLPVMVRFKGPLVFQGKLVKLSDTATELMEGQLLKLSFEMTEPGLRGWLVNATHVYAKKSSVDQWRAVPIGSTVTFRSQLSGIGAMGMGGQYFCVVLLTEAELIESSP